MQNRAKFGVGIGVILVALASLAWLGYGESKTYYHTIAEYQALQGSARNHRMRLAGTVAPGTIKHLPGRIEFVLEEQGKFQAISYIGSDPLPDTFVDKSQALVEGRPSADGKDKFVAEHVQAKCASKYEAAPGGDKPASSSSTQQSTM
ncbi:MAG: cytochrome c maturation protein CcmE [Candidatus Acidiferrum sp.]